MTEHVEEVVAADDLKEGDRVRVSFLGTVDAEGDLRITDAGGYLYRYTMCEGGATIIRLTPIPVLPTKRNALIRWHHPAIPAGRMLWLTVHAWMSVQGETYDIGSIAEHPFTVIFAGEDDQ